MKRYSSLVISFLIFANIYSNEFRIGQGQGISYPSPNISIFLFANIENATIQFVSSEDENLNYRCYKYEQMGIDIKIKDTVAANKPIIEITDLQTNCGYYIEYGEGTNQRKIYVWITKYEPISSVSWDNTKILCSDLKLEIFPYMKYLDLVGVERTIKREGSITYSTFTKVDETPEISEETENFIADTSYYLKNIPTVDTKFEIVDNYAEKLGLESIYTTDTFYTSAVNAFPYLSVNDKSENELDPDNNWEKDEFGNIILYFSEDIETAINNASKFRTSAPLNVDLKSNPSPKVNRYEWFFAENTDFINSYILFEKDINGYIFMDSGIHCIQLNVSNIQNFGDTCNYSSYACFEIAESELFVPNTFTPNGDGANDEFKVAYKSVQSFRCRIYNRWGKKVYDSTDITEGWDGTIGNTKAPIGVYFYIIKAKGTNGQDLGKKGTINLLRKK